MNLEWDSQFDPDNMESAFDSMLSEADTRLVEAMTNAGLAIERGAKGRAPVDTGNLRASIESNTETKAKQITTEVGTNVEYAPFVELGTSTMAAQPFLRPALDAELRSLERKITLAVIEAAEQAGSL